MLISNTSVILNTNVTCFCKKRHAIAIESGEDTVADLSRSNGCKPKRE